MKRFALGLTVVFLLAAGTAAAAVGSIISSFLTNEYTWDQYPSGHMRDAEYVYITFYYFDNDLDTYVARYTPNGSRVSEIGIQGMPPWSVDADLSILGPGYITYNATPTQLWTFSLSTGSRVQVLDLETRSERYAYIPGSSFIFLGDTGVTYRCTTGGSVLSSFPVSGTLNGASAEFNGFNGEYLITESGGTPNKIANVYTGDGSLVSSFSVLAGHGSTGTCGPGYPAYYGTTYWRCVRFLGGYVWCYQIDLDATTNVVPTSLGKIKAIYQ